MNQAALANPSAGGAEIKIPIYKDLVSATESWGDGQLSIADITAPVDLTLGILNTALDPLGAIVGAAVEYLLDLLLAKVKPLADAVDLLLGDPDAIYEHAQKWQQVAVDIAAEGNAHADTVTAAPSWQSPAEAGYRQAQRATNQSFIAGATAAKSMGQWTTAVGAGVGIFRELMWGMLKDFITEIVKAAILALAAAIPTAGGSIPAFGSWLGIRAGMMTAKFSSKLAKLMRWCAKVSRKLGFSGQLFDQAAKKLSMASQNLLRGARIKIQNETTQAPTNPLPEGYSGPTGPNARIPLDPQMPGRTDLGEHTPEVKAKDIYDKARKYGVKPSNDYQTNDPSRGGDTDVRQI